MKTFLFCLVTFLLMKFSYSQTTYYPLVEENKLWYTVESGFGAPDLTHIFKCEGDTVIDDKTYKIVFVTWDESDTTWMKAGYIREDEDRKVYFSPFHNNDSSYFEPGLLYDFAAEVNDSLTITSFPHITYPVEVNIVISGIDSVLVDGSYHKKTWFDCGYNTSYWIEGVGSNSGLVEVGFYCTVVCPGCDLQCVKKDGGTIYPDGYTGSCFIVGIDEPGTTEAKFSIYPNPANEYFIVNPGSHTSTGLQLELYNSLGTLLMDKSLNNSLPTRISTADLQPGIYLYRISDDKITLRKGKIMIR